MTVKWYNRRDRPGQGSLLDALIFVSVNFTMAALMCWVVQFLMGYLRSKHG